MAVNEIRNIDNKIGNIHIQVVTAGLQVNSIRRYPRTEAESAGDIIKDRQQLNKYQHDQK